MRISTVTLAIAPGRSSATRKLTVSYQAIFSPVEVAAKQVVAETVFVQPDRGWIDRYQGYLEEQVGILDSISAHVELKPYSPPAPIAADSNVVQGEW